MTKRTIPRIDLHPRRRVPVFDTEIGCVDLSEESIRLGRLLANLLPETEVRDLLALMLLHESRRRLGKNTESVAAYERALNLTKQAPERCFLQRSLRELLE